MSKKIPKTGSGKTSYARDVTEDEWAFCAPHLTLIKENAPQREHGIRVLIRKADNPIIARVFP